ncbi:MAG TPA: hypothetical protein VGE91_04480 [Solirubrobacterales bacterium]|jgi:hypothetical protein
MSTETPAAAPAASRRTDRFDAARRWASTYAPADLLAAGAIALAGAVLLHWLSRLTFWRDEWGLLLHRRGWSVGTFLDPAVEHLVAIPILIYKLLLGVFGMSSPAPFQVVAVITFLASVVLLYLYVRARLGAWLALAAILPLLFLGPSWDDLLFPYQVTWFGSVACGLASLLCLERESRSGDIAATVLLVAGLLFSDAGIPFVAGAAVEIALSPRRWERAFVPVVPAALWAVWYLGWGHTAHTFVSFDNAANLPSYVLDGLGSSISAYLGLSQPFGVTQTPSLAWGRPLVVLLAGLAAWRAYQLRRPPNRVWVTLAILLCYWALTGLNSSVFGLPTAGRYQYLGVVALALVASELLRGARIGRWATTAILAVAILATLSNVTKLKDAAAGLAGIAQQTRGGLAALELARDTVDPALELNQQNSGVDYIDLLDAGSYLSAVDAYGSPAYSAAELPGAPEPARIAADKVSGAALRIHLRPASPGTAQRCLRVDAARSPSAPVPAGGFVIRAQGPGVQAGLRRYSRTSFPLSLGTLPPGTPQLLQIPPDHSSVPWTLQLTGSGQAAVCPVGAPSP